MRVGNRVEKITGYRNPGIVVAMFTTAAGEKCAVVEASSSHVFGTFNIFKQDELRVIEGDHEARQAD